MLKFRKFLFAVLIANLISMCKFCAMKLNAKASKNDYYTGRRSDLSSLPAK